MPMSPLTAKLVRCEEQFHGTVLGPFVAFGASCILHAEAVCKAVDVFAELLFSQLDAKERQRQREECAAAYFASFRLLKEAVQPSPLEYFEGDSSKTSTPRSAASSGSWDRVSEEKRERPKGVPPLTPWPKNLPVKPRDGESTPSTTIPREPSRNSSDDWEQV